MEAHTTTAWNRQDIHLPLENQANATAFYQAAIALKTAHSNTEGLAEAYSIIAQIMAYRQKRYEAVACFEQAILLYQNLGRMEAVRDIRQELGQLRWPSVPSGTQVISLDFTTHRFGIEWEGTIVDNFAVSSAGVLTSQPSATSARSIAIGRIAPWKVVLLP